MNWFKRRLLPTVFSKKRDEKTKQEFKQEMTDAKHTKCVQILLPEIHVETSFSPGLGRRVPHPRSDFAGIVNYHYTTSAPAAKSTDMKEESNDYK